MKLGLFIDGSFLPCGEGATQRICLLARYLPAEGVETVVFHGYRGWSDLQLIQKEDFTTYILPPEIYYGNPDFLSELVSREEIDVIQMCDPTLILSQGLRIKQRTSVVLVWEVHEVVSRLAKQLGTTRQNLRFLRLLEHYSSLCCDFIICFTREDKDALVEEGVPSDKISIFSCGIDPSKTDFLGPDFLSFTVLFLGNMFYEPNYRGVLSIAKELYPSIHKSREEIKFKMVGTYPKELERKFAGENFIFTGWVDDLNEAFTDTMVAIAPIKDCSGMRIKILDYMAAGLPVVSTSSAAVGINHQGSILIEDDMRHFASKILYLFDSPLVARELGRRARAQIKRYYDWNDIVIALKDFYVRAKDCPLHELRRGTLKAIDHFKLPLPFWLEETLRKQRFAGKECRLDHPAVIRKHKLQLVIGSES